MGGRDGSREAGYQGVSVLPVRNGGQGRVVADAAANISVPGFGHLSISVGLTPRRELLP